MSEIQLARESEFGLSTLQGSGGLKICILPNGCIYSIAHDEILINQLLASPVAGGVHRIHLRIHGDRQIQSICVVGPGANSAMSAAGDEFTWSGDWQGLKYRCSCTLHPTRNAWFFRVHVENRSGQAARYDAILLQDVGLATHGQVRNNELFTSQYIDHYAAEHPSAGFVLMSRQNLAQPGDLHPWLIQGCLPRACGFVTDGSEFFGPSHRGDGVAVALARSNIGTRVRQHEVAYTAIQSEAIDLKPSASFTWTFFADFEPDHPQASSNADLARVDELAIREHRPVTSAVGSAVQRPPSVFHLCAACPNCDFNQADLDRIFPQPHRHVESLAGALASFFHGDDARHVVLRHKELLNARSHGHILRAGRGLMPDDEVISCSCWATGVFASQLTLGNSSLAKLFSGVREPFNVVRSSGLRIFVRPDASQPWQMLGVPAAFEMAMGECSWHYKHEGGLLTVRCIAVQDDPAITFDVRCQGSPVELLISGEIVAGASEYEWSPTLLVDRERKRICVRPDAASLLGRTQPKLAFHIVSGTPDAIESMGGDEALFADQTRRALPYLTIQTRSTSAFRFTVLGTIDDTARASVLCEKYEGNDGGKREGEAESQRPFWRQVTAGVRVRCESNENADAIQDALAWFARDAVIHLSVPRGLDQPNGGAWGVRDVCQGPVEFLLSYGHGEIVAQILRRLFAQQYHRRHDWPQWFMFPPFQQIQSSHCHGDVVIWPLKALCDYLEQTNDRAILHERLPYTDEETFKPTEKREEVVEHVDRLLARLREQFLPGMALPRFGDGDWDDSLQPADPMLRDRMVSSWTTELLYETVRRYASAMKRFGEKQRAAQADALAGRIKEDFQKYLMPDGVVAGFAIFDGDPPRPVEYLLHPSDSRTGLRYRLIPMTRGILSEMFSPQQAQEHLRLIREHLLDPDGARLMDRPTQYAGGRERTFRRSESAAFFGREVGLQYIHAHLRFAEAMAKMGCADALWRALEVVNPIAVTQVVPNARPRQRNCYFSSSDAAFVDRYEASREYGKLRNGEVPVDGGWRVYSSGPGVYTHVVMQHLLGLRQCYDDVVVDPVLVRQLRGICCELTQDGRRVVYSFQESAGASAARGVSVNGRPVSVVPLTDNPYRSGGIRIRKSDFQAALSAEVNRVEIAF